MSFFKKNKLGQAQETAKRRSKKIKQDIAQISISKIDTDRNLDQQIEDLTAKLNNSSQNIFETVEPETVESESIAPSIKAETRHITSETDLSSFDLNAPSPQPSRLNMSEMRMDVARISSDIQGSEELYRRALQRVEGLMGQVEKAEIDFSVLNRLEPENRRLKAQLRTAQSELEGYMSKLGLITADLEDHQTRLNEKTVQYEQARTKLVLATQTLQEYDSALQQSKIDTERQTLAWERGKTALNVEARENKALREKVAELSARVEMRQSDFLDASKAAESLRVDCDEFRKQAETYRAEAQDLRITLNTAKRQNNAMKGEMLALHDDIKTFKTQYEFNVIGREDQVADLEVKLATKSRELDIKKDANDALENELIQIRRVRVQQDIERGRLEKSLDAVTAELAEATLVKETESSRQIALFKKDIRDLQDDLRRSDELSERFKHENDTLQRQLASAETDRKKLQTQLEIQSKEHALIKDTTSVSTSTLEEKIAKLTQDLKIKDEIVQNAAQDVNTLRQGHDAQAAENKRLNDLINDQRYQLETSQKALLESKQSETELNQRYKDVAAALSLNNAVRQTKAPTATPDIKPRAVEDDLPMDESDIEKRILDYKFGISNKII